MVVAYEVQYELQEYFARSVLHSKDNMDYAVSNTLGAIAAVLAACILSFIIEQFFHAPYQTRLLNGGSHVNGKDTKLHRSCYSCATHYMQCIGRVGLGRKSDSTMLTVAEKMKVAVDPARPDVVPPILLEEHEEDVLLETIVELEDHNVWAVLMPAVYQLVPGSMIAKLWFNSLFPPSITADDYEAQNNVFANLMVISTSLALGLVLGFAIVRAGENIFSCMCGKCKCCKNCNGEMKSHGSRTLVPW
jgi:hypothetical protein